MVVVEVQGKIINRVNGQNNDVSLAYASRKRVLRVSTFI